MQVVVNLIQHRQKRVQKLNTGNRSAPDTHTLPASQRTSKPNANNARFDLSVTILRRLPHEGKASASLCPDRSKTD